MPGLFIVFEGLDGVGKTTQCMLLSERIKSTMYSFPTRKGVIGEIIDNYLNGKLELTDQTIHLLFSADRWETKNEILSSLAAGKHVIADRYIPSGIAYSIAKGLPYDWCQTSDIGLPIPDVIIFLKSDNRYEGAERYETADFQQIVSKAYEKVADKTPIQCIWIEVDVKNHSCEKIHEEIYSRIYPFLH